MTLDPDPAPAAKPVAPARTSATAGPRAEHPGIEAARMFLRNPAAIAGMVLLLIVLAVAIAGPWLYPADPFEIKAAPLTPPFSEEAWLGSDYLGRDVLTALIYGGRATLLVGAVAALLSVLIGITLGAFAGYYGGKVDAVLMKITEFFQVLPALLFAMVVVTLFSPTLVTVTLAIGVVSWTGTARLTRAEFLKYRGLEFVRAERAIGARDARIIWKVILPNALPPLVVSATLAIGAAILFEAGLSFLGLGDPNQMSWGLMIGSSRQYVLSCWWAVAFPGAAIFVTVLAVSLIGDGLNDALNPKLRER
ncbi:ABC transporter permease [Variovorax paradoxus]|uniref:ABC transporter permease n=1 Tax=Variovorax TaxID=34072 RepID=UPI0006E5D93E|nr:ABC transporter permease [Variovorax paradoxus]KPV03194.1 ABC transporter permease [Variovorax paradoxus]KPV04421.1 ABC transporter permease [Variovorax paradoxus]KPV14740.1 ABC transporter permease [Variovorax paradoxus]KPV31887.1 ABC transporter permease [Variovorax paradoxus]